MRTAKKVLYLDFDGVLHDEQVYFHPKRGIYIETEGRTLFEWMPILEDLLCPHPGVAIVLSTSWVRMRSFWFAKQQLTPPLQRQVIGATYHHRIMTKIGFELLPRGEQIVNDVLRRGPQSWFALDDDTHYWPEWCRNNLIATNGAKGISDPNVQHAVKTMLERL